VVAETLPVGGYALDDAIVRHTRDAHGLLIGEEQAEQVKIEIGSAGPAPGPEEATVAGRDMVTGLLRRGTLGAPDVREALSRPVAQIVSAVRDTLERTPPELAADVSRDGITLVGGGGLLRGMADRLHAETGLAVALAESPLTCVAVGAGSALEELDVLERLDDGSRRYGR